MTSGRSFIRVLRILFRSSGRAPLSFMDVILQLVPSMKGERHGGQFESKGERFAISINGKAVHDPFLSCIHPSSELANRVLSCTKGRVLNVKGHNHTRGGRGSWRKRVRPFGHFHFIRGGGRLGCPTVPRPSSFFVGENIKAISVPSVRTFSYPADSVGGDPHPSVLRSVPVPNVGVCGGRNA